MLVYVHGNLFDSPADVLVNTVNTVGVMGKGIAKEFKAIYPDMFADYQKLCESGQFKIGQLWLFKSANKWVLNFPTKKHWSQPSTVDYIEAGLKKFTEIYSSWGIHSIAFPELGCGNGELDFDKQVQPLMEHHLDKLPIDIFIYQFKGNTFVDHREPKEFRKWLRTQPGSLAFDEVWEDIVDLLREKNEFETASQQTNFTAALVDDGVAIRFESAARRRLVSKDEFLQIWQQIRTYGFIQRNISPINGSDNMFLFGLLEHLPYMRLVKIADSYPNFSIGLQYDPSGIRQDVQLTQLTLF